jgi:RNA polymerase sigma factor (sigma-70 family)
MTSVGTVPVSELLEEYRPQLVRWARSLLRSDLDAEDAVQDAMLAVLRAPHLLAGVEDAAAWLYTVVRRRCIDLIRRATSRRDYERGAALEELLDEEEPDALDEAERKQLVTNVARAVETLEPALREAFVGNALEGRTFEELSAATGIPMGTLMARKQKAIERIRRELGRQELARARSAAQESPS